MPPGHNDEGVSAAGDADPEAAIRGSVASLMSLPIVKAFVGEEGSKRRELVEKGAVSAMGMAEKMRTHKCVTVLGVGIVYVWWWSLVDGWLGYVMMIIRKYTHELWCSLECIYIYT